MISAQDAFDRLPFPSFADTGPAEVRQPITLAMRAAHRLSSYVKAEPRRLANRAPLVSFTFDDVPESAVSVGARILEDFGARGTFYVSTGLLGQRTIDWRMTGAAGVRRLVGAGHEIALHSHRHRPLAEMTRRAFAADLRDCAVAAWTLAPDCVSANYAYPFGFGHLLHSRALKGVVRSSRTTHPGINAGTVDMHFLKSYPFGTSLSDPKTLDTLLDRTAAGGGWLILTGHDVAERPSAYGCTPHLLTHAVRGAAARNIAIAPIDLALDLCGIERLAAPAGGHAS